jgi:cyclophilin family peptidyl-prolyl cis-trans isomerase
VYNGVSRPIQVLIDVPEQFASKAPDLSILLLDAGASIEEGRRSPVEAGRADLSALFPVLWTTNEPSVRYAQLFADGEAIGPPLVLEPMLSPVRARNGYADALLEAAQERNDEQLRELARLSSAQRSAKKQTIELDASDTRAFSGYRVYRKMDIVLETTLGEMRIATRPDAAPKASYTFADLAGKGFYDGVVFHRVVTDDGRGRPFVIQAGDPTGRGWGGAGFYNDFEPSDLPHDFGVLSVARRPFDPNTNGSQFFVCLSREACAPLDGLYTSFAEVVDGAGVIDRITTLDMVVEGEGEDATPTNRPIEPPAITRARLEPSPPAGLFASRVTREDLDAAGEGR